MAMFSLVCACMYVCSRAFKSSQTAPFQSINRCTSRCSAGLSDTVMCKRGCPRFSCVRSENMPKLTCGDARAELCRNSRVGMQEQSYAETHVWGCKSDLGSTILWKGLPIAGCILSIFKSRSAIKLRAFSAAFSFSFWRSNSCLSLLCACTILWLDRHPFCLVCVVYSQFNLAQDVLNTYFVIRYYTYTYEHTSIYSITACSAAYIRRDFVHDMQGSKLMCVYVCTCIEHGVLKHAYMESLSIPCKMTRSMYVSVCVCVTTTLY
jgi:hypothetical protein